MLNFNNFLLNSIRIKEMRILVTGGSGFIGSNFLLRLQQSQPNYKIINLDAEFYGSHPLNLQSIDKKNYQYVNGNICDKKLVKKLVSKCDIIVNFAAESFVDRSIVNAEPFIKSNILGVFNLLESIKEFKKQMIQISTDEVFGSLKSISATEKSTFNPSSPYAASKSSGEMLVNSYHLTYNSDLIITRCTNNFGPRQFPEKLIPKVILLADQNKPIPVYGNGKNIRDWLFVDDHCDAILKVINYGVSGESYNISGNNELDNLSIIKKILKKMKKSHDLIKFVDDRPGHDFRYSLNSNKIRNKLKWKPKIDFEKGLDITIDWYLKNKNWRNLIPQKTFNSMPWKK